MGRSGRGRTGIRCIPLFLVSNSLTKLKAKMVEWVENGARLGWLIVRKKCQVHVYRPNQKPKILDEPAVVSGAPELPGFSLAMDKIW